MWTSRCAATALKVWYSDDVTIENNQASSGRDVLLGIRIGELFETMCLTANATGCT